MSRLNLGGVETTFFFACSRAMGYVLKDGCPILKEILLTLSQIQHYVDSDQQYPVYRFASSQGGERQLAGLDGGEQSVIIHGIENIYQAVMDAARDVAFCGDISLGPVVKCMMDSAERLSAERGKMIPQIAIVFLDSEPVRCSQDYKMLLEASRYPISFVFVSFSQELISMKIFDDAVLMRYDNSHYTDISTVIATRRLAEQPLSAQAVAVIDDMFSELKKQNENMRKQRLIE